MVAVENATKEGTLDAFLSEDEYERISDPYTGYDTCGTVDHTYWQYEECGAEAIRKGALTDCSLMLPSER